MLFVSGQDVAMYALDTEDGFVMWASESEGQALAPPVVVGSVVYETLISGDYRIRALHAENGREIWVHPRVAEN